MRDTIFEDIETKLNEINRYIFASEDNLNFDARAALVARLYRKMEALFQLISCAGADDAWLVEEKWREERLRTLQSQELQIKRLLPVLTEAIGGFLDGMRYLRNNPEYVRVFLVWHREDFIIDCGQLQDFLKVFPFYARLVLEVLGKIRLITNKEQCSAVGDELTQRGYQHTAKFVRNLYRDVSLGHLKKPEKPGNEAHGVEEKTMRLDLRR